MPRADFAAVTAAIALAPYFAPSSLTVALQNGLEGTDRPFGANIGNRPWACRKDAKRAERETRLRAIVARVKGPDDRCALGAAGSGRMNGRLRGYRRGRQGKQRSND